MSFHTSSCATSFCGKCNSILEKYNVKWKSKSHSCNVKSDVGSQKVIEKSKNHEGIPRVTREVKDHLICYIYNLIVEAKEFSP